MIGKEEPKIIASNSYGGSVTTSKKMKKSSKKKSKVLVHDNPFREEDERLDTLLFNMESSDDHPHTTTVRLNKLDQTMLSNQSSQLEFGKLLGSSMSLDLKREMEIL